MAQNSNEPVRRYPIGTEYTSSDTAHFRVWAPNCHSVAVHLNDSGHPDVELASERNGYFSGTLRDLGFDTRYQFLLNGKLLCADPASRFQPEGPHGPSMIVRPESFGWSDASWKGVTLRGQVVYEMHIGTFTEEGTWNAATEHLPYLAELGITVIELMPIAEFPGKFGWGYDGVNLFAPTRLYGEPNHFRRFVDRAHQVGIGVILDVVYNHFGPDGNMLKQFADSYFTTRYPNDWGEAINFDGNDSGPVREFFLANAAYWIDEYHLDGLRLDATQQIYDSSSDNILAVIARVARAAAGERSIILIAENECQHTNLVIAPEKGGIGLDALWNDDFHHLAMVTLVGRNHAYYKDYTGTPQEYLSCIKWGYLYQGQRYSWQKQRRGRPAFGLEPEVFVNYLENHDQVANSATGMRPRALTSQGRYRAMTAFMLLSPGTPMLFQGQEFGSTSPFFYFADHNPELNKLVYAGRREFLKQFVTIAVPEMQARVLDPSNPETFNRSKLDHAERDTNREILAMHRDLLRFRKTDPTVSSQHNRSYDGAVLSADAFLVRLFGASESGFDDRLILVNFGRDLHFEPAPEPLIAPPLGRAWATLWSSEDPRYGGGGMPALDNEEIWHVLGESTVLYQPIPHKPVKQIEERV